MDKIMVAGSGVLGAQIAFQSAFHGCQVVVYDVDEEQIDKLDEKWVGLGKSYTRDLEASQDNIDAAVGRLSGTTDLAAAVKDSELVIEAVPESLDIKKDFYQKLAEVAPEETIFVTNSSMLLPSDLAEITGRPERFLALHFANQIWLHNTAEVMGHADTDEAVFDSVVAFAEQIGMVPLPLKKEQPGYILNSLLTPFCDEAMKLAMKGVAEPAIIDKTWKIATSSPHGPFEVLDVIGLRTSYNVSMVHAGQGSDDHAKMAQWLKENYIDKGLLGAASGQGFYRYDEDGNKVG